LSGNAGFAIMQKRRISASWNFFEKMHGLGNDFVIFDQAINTQLKPLRHRRRRLRIEGAVLAVIKFL